MARRRPLHLLKDRQNGSFGRLNDLSQAERDELVTTHLWLVAIWARRYAKKGWIEYDDVYQWGCLGLVRASRIFDKARGLDFRPIANCKVRGAIIDGIRVQVGDRRAKHLWPEHLSLDETFEGDPASPLLESVLAVPPDDRAVEAKVTFETLRAAVPGVNRRAVEVVRRVNIEDHRQSELAGSMRISPGRVSQLYLQGVKALREAAGVTRMPIAA